MNMTAKSYWDKAFAEAHLTSWPTAGLCIQNVNPSPSQGSRNIFKEDKDFILAAAKKHGYRQMDSGKVVSFIKNKKP